MAVESMEMVVESMEMDPGAIPCPGRVPEQILYPPNLLCDGSGAAELYLGKHRLI
jgi:hypothetical protein